MTDVENVIKSRTEALKCMSVEEVMVNLPKAIESIASSFCGAVLGNQLKETVTECYGFLSLMYDGLSIDEIKRAFVLAAKGMIEADLVAYKGVFSVKILGDVLEKYLVYRNRIASAMRNAEKEQDYQEKLTKRDLFYKSQAGRQQIADFWENQLAKCIAMADINATKVTSKLYEYLDKCGKLRLEPAVKREYMRKAKEVYQAELESEKIRQPALKRMAISSVLYELSNHLERNFELSEEVHTRIVGLAQRLAVVDYVKSIQRR